MIIRSREVSWPANATCGEDTPAWNVGEISLQTGPNPSTSRMTAVLISEPGSRV